MELFTKNNVFDFISNNYNALPTMGGRAITDDINMFMVKVSGSL
jgi:hypothetical protein